LKHFCVGKGKDKEKIKKKETSAARHIGRQLASQLAGGQKIVDDFPNSDW